MPESSITPLIQKYTVDFASSNNFLFVKGIQGDGYGTRYVDITLVNNTAPYTINQEAVRVVIRGTKPDGTAVFNECEMLDDNTIRVEITQQMSAVAGKGNYEISIMSLETNQALTSFPFFIMTSQSSFDIGYVVSSDEFGLLVEKINQVDQLDKEVNESIDRAEEAIANAETATDNANSATQAAINATDAMNELHDTVSAAEEQRIENENKRQEDTAAAIEAANQATSAAQAQTGVMEELESSLEAAEAARVEAENLRQENTATAIQNAEQATQSATDATNAANQATTNAIAATEDMDERLSEYDSLNLPTVTQNAITATSEAQTATTAAQEATSAAQAATEAALEAIEDIQEALGIDDTTEGLTTTWSSSHIHEVIKSYNSYRMSDITIQSTDWNGMNLYISNENITSTSVIDIYYNDTSIPLVADFDLHYAQGEGWIQLTSTYTPYDTIVIDAIVITNEFNSTTGSVSGNIPSGGE